MGIFLRIIAIIAGGAGGYFCLTHYYQLTQLFGHNSLAERYLGDGGTYNMWKLLGVAFIIGGIVYAFH